MVTLRMPVNQHILKWVRQTASSNLNEHYQQMLADWISGTKVPTIRQLEEVSNSAHVPFGYFFLNEVPDEDISVLKFRTVDNVKIDTPSRDLIDVINDVETKQTWLSEHRQKEGYLANGFSNGFQNYDTRKSDGENVARDILGYLGLKRDWSIGVKGNRFKYLRKALDAVGVTTMSSSYVINNTRRKLDPHEFRAFALADKYAPFIFINSNDSFNAMLFSLIHEMVHIWYGTSETYNYDYKTDISISEQEINRVSEQILFPDQIFNVEWKKIVDVDEPQKIIELARIFGASALSVAIKALHLHLVSQEVVTKVQHDLTEVYRKQKKERSQNGGGPDYYRVKVAHLDKAFIQDVNRSVKGGDISYTKAFELVNVKGPTGFDKLLEAAD